MTKLHRAEFPGGRHASVLVLIDVEPGEYIKSLAVRDDTERLIAESRLHAKKLGNDHDRHRRG